MLLQRAITAAILAPLVILLILFASTAVFAAVAAAAFLAALWEWVRLSGLKSVALQAILLIVAAAVFALLWMARLTLVTPTVIGLGVLWWLVACFWLRHFAYGAAPTLENRALKLLAGALVIFPAWVALITIHAGVPRGHGLALLSLVIVWSADIGAYFSGRTFGKRKLAPQISPGKTWAGAYGALAAGVLVTALGGWWLLDIRNGQLVGLAVLAAVTVGASIVGDLVESLMKRHAQVKDSGTMIPGHGGIMDRLDSVFAALPVFAAGVMLLNLFSAAG
jgi:phosphatidate cytidylyltransferase